MAATYVWLETPVLSLENRVFIQLEKDWKVLRETLENSLFYDYQQDKTY